MPSGKQQTSEIVSPHEHDVLSGRGNFVNYHVGNEHFRALVRKYKAEYVKCPKPQKGKFSRIIVDEVKDRNPPGRFLKQDASTKLWYDIGEKKSLDKTRQALREGAPDLMKEMTGESGDDSDGEDAYRRMSHTGRAPGGFPGDTLNHPYMASVGLQSPIMHQRNFLHMTSPPMASPQFIPPGLLLSAQFSPEMLQLSASRQMHGPGNRMGRLIDTNVIPAPQVHRQMDHSSMNQMGTVQQQMMMNPGMVNNSGMRNNAGMGNEFMDNQAARMGGAMMNQSAAINHQALLSEEQMLQNKLAAIYANNNNQFDSRPMSGPQSDNEMPARDNSPGLHEHFQQNQKVEIPPGQNPRRMPPPSLLKRDDSLKMEKVFSATSPGAESVKKKVDGNASNLSAMSLSLGDMNYEGNLSSVFDNSLRISGVSVKSAKEPTGVTRKSKQERTSNASDNCDMSVATLGISEHGNMSYATFGDPKLQESEGNMSFSRVFEDPDKLP